MKLEDYVESLAYDVAFWMQGLTNPVYSIDELGKLSLEVSEKFRVLGIIVLLTQGQTDPFYHNLIRSGRSRETYLARVQATGLFDDHHWCSGRYESVLDVVAAGDFELARRIVAHSPSEFREEHEYEDDYCYAQIIHRWVQGTPPEEEIGPLLVRWKTYLGDQSSARFSVCRAMAEIRQSDFDEAFSRLLDERERQIEANKTRPQEEEPRIMAQRRVFVEGLSLLRLAELRGLRTAPEYSYCPSLARLPMRTPFPGE